MTAITPKNKAKGLQCFCQKSYSALLIKRQPAVKIERLGAKVSGVETSRYNEMNTESRVSTDNEAQGQSVKLVDANGVILCLN